MKSIAHLLVEHQFFSALPDSYIKTIAACGRNIHLTQGHYLAHEGEEANNFYVLRSGQVAIELHLPNKGAKIIQTLDSGDIAGWSWIFPPYKWNFDLKTVSDLSAISLDAACLRQKCESDPALGYLLMKQFAKIMTDRLKATRLQLLDVYGEKNDGK